MSDMVQRRGLRSAAIAGQIVRLAADDYFDALQGTIDAGKKGHSLEFKLTHYPDLREIRCGVSAASDTGYARHTVANLLPKWY